jgi:homospermidine synthase
MKRDPKTALRLRQAEKREKKREPAQNRGAMSGKNQNPGAPIPVGIS